MSFKVCFRLGDGDEMCINIPVLVRDHVGPDPDPGPYFHDLARLTTVFELAGNLRSEELQKTVQAAAAEGIGTLAGQLPSGVELHHNGEVFGRG